MASQSRSLQFAQLSKLYQEAIEKVEAAATDVYNREREAAEARNRLDCEKRTLAELGEKIAELNKSALWC